MGCQGRSRCEGLWGSRRACPSRGDVGPLVPRRALEADRYNHITATYFLLAERMLREKQEKQGHRLSLVYNLAKEVQSR